MKRVLSLMLIGISLLAIPAHATHFASLEITYEHLGNGMYKIYLTHILDDCTTCAGPLPSEDICITNSCGLTIPGVPNGELQLLPTTHPSYVHIKQNGDTIPVRYGDSIPEVNDCARPNIGPGGPARAERYLIYTYTHPNPIQLGNCEDWSISWGGNARNGAIVNGPANQGAYIEAKLNNMLGQNSTPAFLKPGVKRFCVVTNPNDPNIKPFNWDHPVREADGDSIRYVFSQPQTIGGFAVCTTPQFIAWAAGYSTTSPMQTHFGFQVDAKRGFFTFMPSLAGVFVVKIDVEEYRFNPTRLRWELVGRVSRDMQIPVDQTCRPEVFDGPKLATNACGYTESTLSRDSLDNLLESYLGDRRNTDINNDTTPSGDIKLPIVPYSCGNGEIQLCFDVREPIFCPTINPTDFRLMGPDGIARPIVEVDGGCTELLRETARLQLKLEKPLDVNGDYILQIRNGNDGNTLQNKCGYDIVDNYFLLIRVTDCPTLDYELQNVTVERDEHIRLEFELDSNSFITSAFTRINVLRANNDQQFIKIGELSDYRASSYLDTTVDGYAVDNQIYQYLLQLWTNGNPRVPTNFVNSIVLAGDSTSDTQLKLEWNPYLNDTYGSVAEYEVFSATSFDSTTAEPLWVSEQLVGNNQQFVYDMPQAEGAVFWLKVEAFDPSGVNTKRSSSNWIVYGSPLPPITLTGPNPIVEYVPNVITPNGDQVNDRFYFQFNGIQPGTREYSDLSLSIFNRWGKLVFEDDNFMQRNTEADGWDGTDQNTGNRLADGVYFYTARFTDTQTGKSEEISGSVTLSGKI